MKLLSRNILFAVLTLSILSIIFSALIDQGQTTQAITINELAERINAGAVARIEASGNSLFVEFKDGTNAQAKKESESGLTETLTNYGVETAKLREVAFDIKDESGARFWFGVLIPTLLPVIVIVGIFWFVFRQAKTGTSQMFTFNRSNIRLSTSLKDRVTFKDVAGLKEAKQELQEVVDFLKNPKKKKSSPSILFIDEIDAVGRERGAGLGGGHDEREQTLNQILVEMDGFDRDTRVIVIAATNRPDVLDAALLRPGRFDRRVVLDLPDMKDREEILKIHAIGKPLSGDVNLQKVSVRTPGFSGADLANLLNEAAILAARNNRRTILQQDIYDSVEKVLLGPERRGRVISEKEKKMTAYHEAGHALVTASLKDADPVHKISIISRGRAGGYTLNLPSEDTRLKTKSQFLNDLSILMGGYAAEELVFGDISTGASNDLKEASELSRRLVTKYGMSNLGPATFGKAEEMIFLGRELGVEKNYSEETASKIDGEVHRFIALAYQTAKKIIDTRKKALEAIAKNLLEKETLEQEEFYGILEPFKLKPVAING